MADNRVPVLHQQTVAKETIDINELRFTSLWYGPRSPYLAKQENDLTKFYRHLFFPNKL